MRHFDSQSELSIPVPRIFHSFEHDGPFRSCSSCNAPLLEPGTSYFIEKVLQGKEVIFEYAMCSNCRDTMQTELSFESMLRIGSYMMQHLDIEPRMRLIEGFDNNIAPWLDTCVFTGMPRKDCNRYQICAEFSGPNMLVSLLPMMVCEKAAEDMQELLSAKTRESFGKFIRDTVSPPTNFKDIPIFI